MCVRKRKRWEIRAGRELATATGSIYILVLSSAKKKKKRKKKKIGAHFHSYHTLQVNNWNSSPISLSKAVGV